MPKRALALSCAAEPGISPAQGKDPRNDGGGMNTGVLRPLSIAERAT